MVTHSNGHLTELFNVSLSLPFLPVFFSQTLKGAALRDKHTHTHARTHARKCYIHVNREENAPGGGGGGGGGGGIPLCTTVWPDLFYFQFWDRSHNWVRQPLQIQPSWPVTTLSGQIYVYIIPEFWTHSHGLLGTRKLSRELSQTELSSTPRSIIMRLNMYRERDQHTCQPLAYYNVITNSSYRVYWCSYWSLEH